MNSEEGFTTDFLKRHLGALRLLAFREDDRHNRRLLFDSESICEQGDRNRSRRCQPDLKLLAEMIFGSTPTVCNRESIKVHQFRTPPRIMFTKIFPAHQLNSCSNASRRDQRRFSVDPERISQRSNVNSAGENPPCSNSPSSLRISSPDPSRRSSESSEDCEILPALHRLRRQRIGVAVIFTVGDESQSEDELPVRRRIGFLCSQSSAILAATREDLQDVVLTAYCIRASVADVMKRAWERFLSSMKLLCESSCRAHYTLRYFNISWSLSSDISDPTVKQFVETLCALGAKYDTKQTSFFVSTLVTSVLALQRNRRKSANKKVTELRVTCTDGRLLGQLLDVIGYFLKFVIPDFGCLSVKPVPLSLTRSLSVRSSSKGTGALASLLSMFRNRKTLREATNGDKYSDSISGSPNGYASPTHSSAIPIIYVEENGTHDSDAPSPDANASPSSSLITSSADSATGLGPCLDEDSGVPSKLLDDAEERPLHWRWTAMDVNHEPLAPLCGDIASCHRFANEISTSGRPLDMAVSLGDSVSDQEFREALVIDATTWRVYHASVYDTPCQPTIDSFKPRFPSALITELLENVRFLNAEYSDPDVCLMYLEDEIKILFSKADTLSRLAVDVSDKAELHAEFCTNVVRCNLADIIFLI